MFSYLVQGGFIKGRIPAGSFKSLEGSLGPFDQEMSGWWTPGICPRRVCVCVYETSRKACPLALGLPHLGWSGMNRQRPEQAL